MKKIMAIMSALAFTSTCTSFRAASKNEIRIAAAEQTAAIQGDANADGMFDIADAVLSIRSVFHEE